MHVWQVVTYVEKFNKDLFVIEGDVCDAISKALSSKDRVILPPWVLVKSTWVDIVYTKSASIYDCAIQGLDFNIQRSVRQLERKYGDRMTKKFLDRKIEEYKKWNFITNSIDNGENEYNKLS